MSELRELLASLTAMDADQLRAVWRERLGEPPPVRSVIVLRGVLAEALQVQASGKAAVLAPLPF